MFVWVENCRLITVKTRKPYIYLRGLVTAVIVVNEMPNGAYIMAVDGCPRMHTYTKPAVHLRVVMYSAIYSVHRDGYVTAQPYPPPSSTTRIIFSYDCSRKRSPGHRLALACLQSSGGGREGGALGGEGGEGAEDAQQRRW